MAEHKIGPLTHKQWLLAGGGAVALYLLYQHYSNANTSSTTGTSTSPSSTLMPSLPTGALNATTGYPYSTSGGSTSQTTLSSEMTNLGQLETLLSNLEGIPTSTTNATLNKDLEKVVRRLGKVAKREKQTTNALHKLQNQTRHQKRVKAKHHHKPQPVAHAALAGHANPGHVHLTHPNGRQIATSSAPHNRQQHKNIQPPSHQRAHRKVKP